MNIPRARRALPSRTKQPGRLVADPMETVHRLAVLLSAGTAPERAWRYLSESGDATLLAAADAAEAGADVSDVLTAAGESWIDVAAIWTVALSTGAPLAGTLRSVVGALRDAAEVRADVAVALAEPLATARLLAWLPVVGVPMGALLGFDPVGILTGDAVGRGCLVAGLLLIISAHVWTRRLARRARPSSRVAGLDAELWAVALSAGASVDRARAVISGVDGAILDDHRVGRTLDLATRAGVPAAELLRGDAWIARHRARTEGRSAAARLSTRLLLPLGACTLPAFLLLAVAPAVIGILRSTSVP